MQKTHRKKIAALFLIPVLMFGFGYLMVPIYEIFCEVTGLNGKTGRTTVQYVGKMKVDESRLIKVEFIANLNQSMPLDFAPTVTSMFVHPGKTYQTTYRARNRRNTPMVGQAVPSVSPSKASTHFNKTECFCFSKQPFAPNETRELPLVFVIHPKLPKDIQTLSLAYTFFEVDTPDHDHNEHGHGDEHVNVLQIK